MRFDHVIWDWNGTLLSDVKVNTETINTLLGRRSIPLIPDTETYLNGFSIPVKEYYLSLGFDLEGESFQRIAEEYIAEYQHRFAECDLYGGVRETLGALAEAGVKQYIVSSAEDERLKREVASFGIADFFHEICGKSDNLGGGKVAVAQRLMAERGMCPDRVLFVGDLTHDAEVAKSVGCPCVLIPKGHQSRERLSATGATVIEEITHVPRYVTGI